MGTKTVSSCLLPSGIRCLLKKIPKHGDENHFRWIFFPSSAALKKIPKHGDENISFYVYIVNHDVIKKIPKHGDENNVTG